MPLKRGDLVRVHRKSGHGHWGRGRVIAVGKTTAFVKPFGRHRKVEEIALSELHHWKAKSTEHKRRA